MLYVPFANTLVRDTVVDFLNRPDFAKDLKQISATLRSPFVANSLTGGENLGYLPDYVDPSCLAGFHASEITRLNWAVCVWAAVKFPNLANKRIVQFIEKLNTVWESENRLQPTAPKM